MNDINAEEQVQYFDVDWSAPMALDCATAQRSIAISAISMQPPRHPSDKGWPRLWESWCAAARRGVDVHVWLPSPSSKYPATLGNGRAGLELVKNKMWIHNVNGSQLLHAKTCVIDDLIVYVGSGNFTAAAVHFNHESYVRFCSEKIAEKIQKRLTGLA